MIGGYETHQVRVDTDGDGAGSALSGPMSGRIIQVDYVKDADSGYSDGATFSLAAERPDGASEFSFFASEAGQIDAHAALLPGFPTLDHAGTESGSIDFFVVVQERIRITVAAGGANKTGLFIIKVAK